MAGLATEQVRRLKKNIMVKIFLVIFAIFVSAVVSLEALNRAFRCTIPDCRYRCPSGPHNQSSPELVNLKLKRLANKKISKEDYYLAAKKLILEEEPGKMGCLNGLACGDIGYVRKDLTEEAKRFVQRHELEHLLQTGKERNREFSANFAAGKEYPWGLIQTTSFSIRNRAKYYSSPLCYLLTLWKTFKIYFLP